MSRRHSAEKRIVLPDAKYNDKVVAKFINNVMEHGKKAVAEKIVYSAFDIIASKSKQDALTLAAYAGFDLVLMSENSNPPVCKIMDYNRFRYEKKKKAKDALKKQREAIVETKEFRLSTTIDIHDFNTRVKNARKNLEKGAKIKASIRFKGRQISHPELAKDVLIRFSDELSDIAQIEIQPKMEGRTMYMQLTPKK